MILLALTTIPIAVAVLSALSRRARFGSTITLIGAAAILGLSVRATLDIVASPKHVLVAIPHWIALDGLGALILLCIAVVSLTAALFSVGYMDFEKTGGVRRYYVNFNLFIFSMLIVPLIQEPSLVWVAVELTTLFSVLLVGFENTHEALEAAWKYVVLTIMGAAIALFGFLVLYWAAKQAGASHHTWSGLLAVAPQMSPVLLKASFVLILVGFGAKIGLVPLHTWLPDAHSQAPTPVCALLSGVETTAVLYVILRLLPVVSAATAIHANTSILIFGLVSVGTAAFLLLGVRDYKRLFAFSTVEHMGIILVAVGLGGALAHEAAMLQIVGHALTKLHRREDKIVVERARCIHCYRCARGIAKPIPWETGFEWARIREGSAVFAGTFRRSMHIRVVDAGDCGACLNETKLLNNPYYNMHRLGFFITPTPRQADILLVVGPVTDHMKTALLKAYEAMPTPKRVMAVGACALSGGVFEPGFVTGGGVADLLPVDVEIPGCPPPPLAILHGLLVLAGRKTADQSTGPVSTQAEEEGGAR